MKHFRTEVNPVTGAREDFFWDEMNQVMTMRTRTDVTNTLETNKRKAANNIDGRYGKQMMHHVAEIPDSVAYKWLKEDGIQIWSNDPEMKKRVRRKLEDPEWRYLKSTNKRLYRG